MPFTCFQNHPEPSVLSERIVSSVAHKPERLTAWLLRSLEVVNYRGITVSVLLIGFSLAEAFIQISRHIVLLENLLSSISLYIHRKVNRWLRWWIVVLRMLLTFGLAKLNWELFFIWCTARMPKVKLKQPMSGVSAETNEQTKCNKGKAKAGKKGKPFYKHMEPKPNEAKKNASLPPRDATEFSANWKSLLLVSNCDINCCVCAFTCL